MLRPRMASLNVAEWSPEQVADWLTGLGPTVARYVPALRARKLNGARLLALRCDDLDALGVYVIGHQELMLEAVEHLRNFQFELRRECVQQLAVRVSVVATGVARALKHCPERLDTQTLADVARAVTAVKPLACWLHRWSLAGGAAAGAGAGDTWRLGERAERLLRLALEAATCAQRDRFADQPARDLRRNATATAAAADCIIQDVSDPLVLRAASLDAVTLRQSGRPLGFTVLRSCCAHHHLTDIRFGSPAHASGLLYPGDEIVQVDGQCVVGWDGPAVTNACAAAGSGDLSLRVRRRAPRPCHTHLPARTNVLGRNELTTTALPLVRDPAAAPAEPPPPRAGDPADSDSDALSPPASPDHTHPDHTRMYPPKPHALMQRRHSVCGGSPVSKRPHLSIEQFWQELQERRAGEAPDWGGLYRRDKAVSCSTGLQLSPRRPRTALGMAGGGEEEARRGRLDKSHSTPAYGPPPRAPPPPPAIPESPASRVHVRGKVVERLRRITDEFTTEDETDQDTSLVETINPSLPDVSALQGSSEEVNTFESPTIEPKRNRNNSTSEDGRRSDSPPPPPPRPSLTGSSVTLSVSPLPALRPVPRNPQTQETVGRLKPVRGTDGAAHISPPLRTLAPPLRRADVTRLCDVTRLHDVTAPHTLPRGTGAGGGVMTASTPSPLGTMPAAGTPHTTPEGPRTSPAASVVRGIFPSARSRDIKKNNSLLAKRRMVSARSLAARGGVCCGAVWQRVRAAPATVPAATASPAAPAATASPAAPRWVPRHLLLAHSMLYAFRDAQSEKADCMIYLEGFTASAATEVKSRAHAFKVYNQSSAFYFACASREATAAWLQLIHRATLLPSLAPVQTKQFSETDYSETESDSENPDRETSKREKEKEREKEREKDKDKDKGKFGSLKKFRRAHASQESVAAASLDRKYLRFFSRHRTKDDAKQKAKQGVPLPTEHYRSYRRAPPSPKPASPVSPAPSTPSPASPPSLVLPADARCKKLPKPINYIHASNPNLVDYEKSDICARLSLRGGLRGVGGVRGGRKPYRPENFIGLTLEEFMLKKQEEERRQVYTNRVLMGVERGTAIASAAAAAAAAADVTAQAARAAEEANGGSGGELQERLRRIVPDVIYGELPSEALPPREPAPPPVAPRAGRAQPMVAGKPISIKGKDGYEKIVYPEDLTSSGEQKEEDEDSLPSTAPPPPARPHPPYSLKRNHKVHSGNTPDRPRAPLSPPAPPQDRWARGAGGASTPVASGGTAGAAGEGEGAGAGGVARLRLVFAGRSPDQETSSPVTSTSSASEGGATPRGLAAVYPHLQCPPTFQPETYCLARLQPRKHP